MKIAQGLLIIIPHLAVVRIFRNNRIRADPQPQPADIADPDTHGAKPRLDHRVEPLARSFEFLPEVDGHPAAGFPCAIVSARGNSPLTGVLVSVDVCDGVDSPDHVAVET